jgi:hypothetical protein
VSSTEAEGGFDNREEGRRVAETDRALEARETNRTVGAPHLRLAPVQAARPPAEPGGGVDAGPSHGPGRPARPKARGAKLPGTVRGNLLQIHTTMSRRSVELIEANKRPDETGSGAVLRALQTAAPRLIEEARQRPEPEGLFAPRPRRKRSRLEDPRLKRWDFLPEEAADLVELSKQTGIANYSELIERAVTLAFAEEGGL